MSSMSSIRTESKIEKTKRYLVRFAKAVKVMALGREICLKSDDINEEEEKELMSERRIFWIALINFFLSLVLVYLVTFDITMSFLIAVCIALSDILAALTNEKSKFAIIGRIIAQLNALKKMLEELQKKLEEKSSWK